MPEKGRRDGVDGPDSAQQLLRRGDSDEDWLQCSLRNLYQSVVDEPVPQELIDIVTRITELDSSTTGSSNSARRNDRPDKEQARARRWRAKALEIRAVADTMSNETAGRSLGQLARSYEILAEHAEKRCSQGRAKNRDGS